MPAVPLAVQLFWAAHGAASPRSSGGGAQRCGAGAARGSAVSLHQSCQSSRRCGVRGLAVTEVERRTLVSAGCQHCTGLWGRSGPVGSELRGAEVLCGAGGPPVLSVSVSLLA